MTKLNKSQPYGRITPPWKGAAYQQGDRYFDSHENEIPELGPTPAASEPAPAPAPASNDPRAGNARALLDQVANGMNFMAFRSQAHKVLGSKDLSKKNDLIPALEAIAG